MLQHQCRILCFSLHCERYKKLRLITNPSWTITRLLFDILYLCSDRTSKQICHIFLKLNEFSSRKVQIPRNFMLQFFMNKSVFVHRSLNQIIFIKYVDRGIIKNDSPMRKNS